MNKKIGAYEAKTRLPEILRRVEAGERFTVTNRGRPVADILPRSMDTSAQVEVAIDNILRQTKPVVNDEQLQALKSIGRR